MRVYVVAVDFDHPRNRAVFDNFDDARKCAQQLGETWQIDSFELNKVKIPRVFNDSQYDWWLTQHYLKEIEYDS